MISSHEWPRGLYVRAVQAPAGQFDQEGTITWSRRRDRAEDAVCADAVQAASALAAHLQGGGELQPLQVDDVPLADGEVVFADVTCSAARFYGTEVAYPPSTSGYFEDHPTFGRRWVSNGRLDARRRQEAEDAALP